MFFFLLLIVTEFLDRLLTLLPSDVPNGAMSVHALDTFYTTPLLTGVHFLAARAHQGPTIYMTSLSKCQSYRHVQPC